MSRARVITILVLAVLGLRLRAADAPAAPVQLPPMLIEESVSSVPWLYVNVGGTEFLSRCSTTTTIELVEAWLTQLQYVRVILPEEFLGRMDVPGVFVLYAQDLRQTVSAEIQRELQGKDPGGAGVNIAPSMRLADRDMHASIAYIDETLFDAAGLSVAPSHVKYLLKVRVPELPAWLVDGAERMWRDTDFVLEPITFRPLIWHDEQESGELAGDALRPRALLPASELFAGDAERTVENRHARHLEARAATQALFVRWATLAGGETREAFWKFAARAAEGPVNEEMFESIFGFDYAELRDRLSDYLTKAVAERRRIFPRGLPPLADFTVDRATANQIARVRGEWERLAIEHVQRKLPQAREPYLAQARRTLHRAYNLGDRDPRLLATMGLTEVDAGNETEGRAYLEAAVNAGVVRPRAYYELARLRFAELQRGAPETKQFAFSEIAPVIHTLQQGLTQAPPLPEMYGLLGEAWARSEIPPSAVDFAQLEKGARMFHRQPTVAYPTALALARHGKKEEAGQVLEACAGYAADDRTQAGIARLRAELPVQRRFGQ